MIMFRRSLTAVSIGTIFLYVAPVKASWFSDIIGINIDVPDGRVTVGLPNPAAIGPMLQNLPKDFVSTFLNPYAPALAFLIRQAKAQAIPFSQPIPDSIRQELAPYFPAAILNGTRWALYDPGRITLDTLITMFQHEGAIT